MYAFLISGAAQTSQSPQEKKNLSACSCAALRIDGPSQPSNIFLIPESQRCQNISRINYDTRHDFNNTSPASASASGSMFHQNIRDPVLSPSFQWSWSTLEQTLNIRPKTFNAQCPGTEADAIIGMRKLQIQSESLVFLYQLVLNQTR